MPQAHTPFDVRFRAWAAPTVSGRESSAGIPGNGALRFRQVHGETADIGGPNEDVFPVQPFIPDVMRLSMKNRCRIRNTIRLGMISKVAAAAPIP